VPDLRVREINDLYSRRQGSQPCNSLRWGLNMRIGIDAHMAEREGTGNCTYTQQLLKNLAEIDQRNEYVLYVTDRTQAFYSFFKNRRNFTIKELTLKSTWFRTIFSLAKETYADAIDVLHVTYFAPPWHQGKLVVTIHDLAIYHYPIHFGFLEKTRFKIWVPYSARRAAKVITVSKFTKNDLAQTYCLPASNIEAVYNGVGENFRPVSQSSQREIILKKYKISNPFIFALGRLNSRKNLNALILAFHHLSSSTPIPHSLIIAGKNDYRSSEIGSFIQNLNLERKVKMVGYVPDEELPAFFSSAVCFVFPSVFEGFGLPVVEAMACGCPVISSNTSAIPEVIGDAGILINPYDTGEISQAIFKMISDDRLRSKLREKGLKRAKLFSWKETARRTLSVYESVF